MRRKKGDAEPGAGELCPRPVNDVLIKVKGQLSMVESLAIVLT